MAQAEHENVASIASDTVMSAGSSGSSDSQSKLSNGKSVDSFKQQDDLNNPEEDADLKQSELETAATESAPIVDEPQKPKKLTKVQRMEDALVKIDKLLDLNADRRAKLTAQEQLVTSELDAAFVICVQKVTARAVELKAQYSGKNKEQMDLLSAQQEKLARFRGSVTSGLKDPNGMMAEESMVDMISNILRATEEEAAAMRIPDYQFDGDAIGTAQFISELGVVDERAAAPTIAISSISHCSMKITLDCEQTDEIKDQCKDGVIYGVRYRLKPNNTDNAAADQKDDDAKNPDQADKPVEQEWKQEVLAAGDTVCTITDLAQESVYEVYGVYKLSANGIWSESSEVMEIQTKKVDTLDFVWDKERKHEDIRLRNKSTTVKLKKSDFWRAVVSKNVLDSDSMVAASWEVTLNDIRGDKGLDGLKLGFVDVNAADDVRLGGHSLGSPERPKECALYVYKHCLYKQAGDECTTFDAKWKGSMCKDGDRIMLRFDFINGHCTVLYNDELVGILADKLPFQFHLVANPYSAITLDTTKFECVTYSM